jgi:ribosomal protein S18 acetylase RimI-like enzyme
LQTITIKDIPSSLYPEAVEIFTQGFSNDPLFLFAFPEEEQRKRLTKIMYEFVVYDLVPKLNLKLKGAFIDDIFAGCIIYTTPDARGWSDEMNDAIAKMQAKANDKRINLIGEYARLKKYDPAVPHFYGNEHSVKKEYRKHGIGKALAEYMINECESHPASWGIVIDTANPDNVPLYQKWGFVLKATIDFYDIKSYAMWRENSV